MTLPATKNIAIYQGDTWRLTLHVRAKNTDGTPGALINLTGVTTLAQVRPKEDSDEVWEMESAIGNQTTDVGSIHLALSPEQTVDVKKGKWDLQVTWVDGDVQTLLKGNVTVTAEVSRGG